MPTLVVGYVDSPEGNAALDHAAGLAQLLDADLHIVHVVDLADYPVDPDSSDWEQQGRARLSLIRSHAISHVGALRSHTTYAENTGDPAHALQEAAYRHSAMMVVVGLDTRTSNPLTRLLSSNVTKSLIRYLECPVLLVPLPR